MSKFQKFMFDNFVIKSEEDSSEVVSVSIEEEGVAKEIITDIGSEEIVEDVSSSEDVEFFDMPEETYHPIEEVENIVSYTEEELQAAVLAAKEEGKMVGRQEAEAEHDSFIPKTIEKMSQNIQELLSSKKDIEQENEEKILFLCRDIVKKVLPSLNEKYAIESIGVFLKDNFSHFTNSPKLSFYFNPDIIKDIQPIIAKLANSYDFEGKISLHKDSELSISDCRVEWDNGGVEKREDKILDKIDELIENSTNTPNMEK